MNDFDMTSKVVELIAESNARASRLALRDAAAWIESADLKYSGTEIAEWLRQRARKIDTHRTGDA